MTKKELLEALKDVPDDMSVYVCDHEDGWLSVDTASVQEMVGYDYHSGRERIVDKDYYNKYLKGRRGLLREFSVIHIGY